MAAVALWVTAAAMGLWPPLAAAAAPHAQDLQARDWALSCLSCHSAATPATTLSGSRALMTLAGRPAPALLATLRALRDGTTSSTLMRQLLAGYSDDEIARIAAYFAAQPAPSPVSH